VLAPGDYSDPQGLCACALHQVRNEVNWIVNRDIGMKGILEHTRVSAGTGLVLDVGVCTHIFFVRPDSLHCRCTLRGCLHVSIAYCRTR
jgi:hypothetical protein